MTRARHGLLAAVGAAAVVLGATVAVTSIDKGTPASPAATRRPATAPRSLGPSSSDDTSSSTASTTTVDPSTSAASDTTTSVPAPTVPTTTVAAPTSAAGGPPLVTVVGDSITDRSRSDIDKALGHDYDPTVQAVGGTTIGYWTAFIQSVVQSEPPHDWVVELGTKDVFQANPAIETDFDNEVGQLSGQRCVVLVTVNPHFSPSATQLDQSMASVSAQNHAFHLLDWGDIELQNPAWLIPDHIHPSPRGSAELAKLMRRALNADC